MTEPENYCHPWPSRRAGPESLQDPWLPWLWATWWMPVEGAYLPVPWFAWPPTLPGAAAPRRDLLLRLFAFARLRRRFCVGVRPRGLILFAHTNSSHLLRAAMRH